MEDLRNKVVVVTGASSGIGRETALQLAARGCRLVLAARRGDELDEVASRCRESGGEARAVPTDVTREKDIANLVGAAMYEWGRIDVLVNNAGVTMFGHLDQGAFEEHRRVIETNLYGPLLAARAVLPVFRQQGTGIIINVGSVLSKIGQPFVPSYVISKFGLRGLSEALRAEVADDPDIHVCTLLPYAVDTPHFESGGNVFGREARAMPPMQSPEKVARAIVELIERPRRERHIPGMSVVGLALHWMLPRTTERLLTRALQRFHFGAPQPPTEGSIHEPLPDPGSVHGNRPPKLSGPSFAVWIARELVRIEADTARHWIRRWREQRTTS